MNFGVGFQNLSSSSFCRLFVFRAWVVKGFLLVTLIMFVVVSCLGLEAGCCSEVPQGDNVHMLPERDLGRREHAYPDYDNTIV